MTVHLPLSPAGLPLRVNSENKLSLLSDMRSSSSSSSSNGGGDHSKLSTGGLGTGLEQVTIPRGDLMPTSLPIRSSLSLEGLSSHTPPWGGANPTLDHIAYP